MKKPINFLSFLFLVIVFGLLSACHPNNSLSPENSLSVLTSYNDTVSFNQFKYYYLDEYFYKINKDANCIEDKYFNTIKTSVNDAMAFYGYTKINSLGKDSTILITVSTAGKLSQIPVEMWYPFFPKKSDTIGWGTPYGWDRTSQAVGTEPFKGNLMINMIDIYKTIKFPAIDCSFDSLKQEKDTVWGYHEPRIDTVIICRNSPLKDTLVYHCPNMYNMHNVSFISYKINKDSTKLTLFSYYFPNIWNATIHGVKMFSNTDSVDMRLQRGIYKAFSNSPYLYN